MSMSVRDIQEALVRAGFDPGPVDGIWGRRTVAAVKAFQEREGLEVDGIVGPVTAAHLQGATRPADDEAALPLPWMEEATRLIHTREVAGRGDNPAIIGWADMLDLAYSGDDIPWCGLFVAHCIASTLPAEPLPTNPLLAQSWRRFGSEVAPREGAVMVFWRESRESGLGHVGFYAGQDNDAYRILGGNQGDSVCYDWVARQRFLGAYWPKTALSLQKGARVVEAQRSGALSRNEA